MDNFSLRAFRDAFNDILHLQDGAAKGSRLHCLGGAEGVGLDLVRAAHNSDRLCSASLQFALKDGAEGFDDFCQRCIDIFLVTSLGSAAAGGAWAESAFRHLKSDGVSSCTTTHDGFSLRLMQMKPYPMFLLTLTDDFADDNCGGEASGPESETDFEDTDGDSDGE